MFDTSTKNLFLFGKRKSPMKKSSKIILFLLVLAAVAGGVAYTLTRPPGAIVLTGIVTTDEVIVSPQIQGRLQQLLVKEGDAVTNGELLAVIQPQEQQANMAFFTSSQQQTTADLAQAQADLENARLNFERIQGLYSQQRRVGAGLRPGADGLPVRRGARRVRPETNPGGGRANGKSGGAIGSYKNFRARRRHRGQARGVAGRSRQSRPGHRHAHQSGRSLGARRRRGDLTWKKFPSAKNCR